MNPRYLAALTFAVALLTGAHSQAFCRATGCDRSQPDNTCQLDHAECEVTGKLLFWASSCVRFSVQQDAGPKHHIDYATFQGSVERAFSAWTSATCQGGGAPSLDVQVDGPIACDTSEYNSTRGNANIVMFREDDWPYVGSEDALGITRLRFDPDTGELWDADIEINAVGGQFSVGDPVIGVDLDSLLTHEAGHALGLAHSLVAGATMKAGYTNDDSMRSLEVDDVDGACAIYPPDRKAATSSCEERHGFSALCGSDQPEPEPEPVTPPSSSSCGVVFPPSSGPGTVPSLGAALLLGCLLRRRFSHPRMRETQPL
jgi:Matrixin